MKTSNLFVTVCAFAVGLVTGPVYAKPDHNKNNHPHNGQGLPPGLYKKHKNGKPLPPGWQKKLHRGDILDDSIYARGRIVVPLGKDGSISIEVEGTFITLHEKTRTIIGVMAKI